MPFVGSISKKAAAATIAAAKTRGEFNPISRWEEPIEIPTLTLYDVHRTPRRVNDDPNARVRVALKQVSSEFHCPVCLAYMKKPVTVMECLHRFCGECIQKCLRIGKKECPSCRIHIPSRRSLRPDPNFGLLMKNIYGDIDKLENQEEKEIETLNKAKNMNNAYAESRKLGIMQQARHRRKKAASPGQKVDSVAVAATNRTTAGAKRKASAMSAAATIAGLEESDLVNFSLRRHPQETLVDRLDKEILRTSKDMTVCGLKKFLSKKLSFGPYTQFQILSTVGTKSTILEDSITLGEARAQIADSSDAAIMVLHYRIFPVNY